MSVFQRPTVLKKCDAIHFSGHSDADVDIGTVAAVSEESAAPASQDGC